MEKEKQDIKQVLLVATYQGAAQKSICEEHLKELAFLNRW